MTSNIHLANYEQYYCSLSLFPVHHGQRRHLLAAHKIIHGEVNKLINVNETPTTNEGDVPAGEDQSSPSDNASHD